MKDWTAPAGYIEKKYNYTYKLTFKKDPRYFYYGVHCTNIEPKYDNYFGSGTNVKEYKKIYGNDCFDKEILEFFPTKKEALLAEDKLVPIELLSNEFCLNKIQGGGNFDTTGYKMSDEEKKKLSKIRKGRKRTKESIEKMIATRRERGTDKHSEETRKKLSEINKNHVPIIRGEICKHVKREELEKWLNEGWKVGYPESRNKKVAEAKMKDKNPMYGKHWTQEQKDKMVQTKMERGTNKHSEETKEKLAKINREHAKDPEFRKKLSEACKGRNTWCKGRKFVNNGIVEKSIIQTEIQGYLQEGWQLGRLKRKKAIKK